MAAKQVFPISSKADLEPGDEIILTKPIGSGVLLAAAMQSLCRAEQFQSMVQQMLLSNQVALELLQGEQVSGLTDVTGFGLAGHLLEMLRASEVSADIVLDDIAIYDGVDSLTETAGIESTLTSQNREIENQIIVNHIDAELTKFKALFDPQTCGGLLIGVSGNSEQVLDILFEHGFEKAAKIGRVTGKCSIDNVQRLKVVT